MKKYINTGSIFSKILLIAPLYACTPALPNPTTHPPVPLAYNSDLDWSGEWSSFISCPWGGDQYSMNINRGSTNTISGTAFKGTSISSASVNGTSINIIASNHSWRNSYEGHLVDKGIIKGSEISEPLTEAAETFVQKYKQHSQPCTWEATQGRPNSLAQIVAYQKDRAAAASGASSIADPLLLGLAQGATQALAAPGNDAAKIGAGLMGASQSMLNSTANLQATNPGIGNDGSLSSLGNQAGAYSSRNSSYGSSSSGNSNCPVNFNSLSVSMSVFSDPMLQTTREFILNYTTATVVSYAKSRGWSKGQAVEMAMRQADKFEEAAQQNARATSEVSTYLTPKAIVMGVNSGRLPLFIL